MSNVQDLQLKIKSLPHKEYIFLISWIHEQDWEKWDKQLESDVASGKLDFLFDEAMKEKNLDKLKII